MVSKVISTLIGVISIVTLVITLVTKSHDPLSKDWYLGVRSLGLGHLGFRGPISGRGFV